MRVQVRDLERRSDGEGRDGEDVVDLLGVLIELIAVSFLGSEVSVKLGEDGGEDVEGLHSGELKE